MIAGMREPDPTMDQRLHAIIKAIAPAFRRDSGTGRPWEQWGHPRDYHRSDDKTRNVYREPPYRQADAGGRGACGPGAARGPPAGGEGRPPPPPGRPLHGLPGGPPPPRP